MSKSLDPTVQAQPVPVGTVHAARLWVSHEEGVSALGELELSRHNRIFSICCTVCVFSRIV